MIAAVSQPADLQCTGEHNSRIPLCFTSCHVHTLCCVGLQTRSAAASGARRADRMWHTGSSPCSQGTARTLPEGGSCLARCSGSSRRAVRHSRYSSKAQLTCTIGAIPVVSRRRGRLMQNSASLHNDIRRRVFGSWAQQIGALCCRLGCITDQGVWCRDRGRLASRFPRTSRL